MTSVEWTREQIKDVPVEWEYERQETTHGILMDFVVDRVDTPDGGHMVRNYLRHPDAIGVIAMDDEFRIVVEKQYRHPVRRRLVEAPAGLCDVQGEALLDTAKRELAEEVRLAASDWRILCDVFATPGCSTQATRVFLARGLTPVPRPDGFTLEAEEADMAIGWVALDDMVDAIHAGDVMNPTLVTGIMALKTALLSSTVDQLRTDSLAAVVTWMVRALTRESGHILIISRQSEG